MPPQPPLILVDNIFDRISLYPTATLRADAGYVVGREPQYVADYRRERTYFQVASVANPQIVADLGVGNSAVVDTVWIDRGHNLWGRTVALDGSPDGHTVTAGDPTLFTRAVPALGTVGGDPTTSWCVTEEGALYTMVTNVVARRSWRLYDVGTAAWTLPGLIVGKRHQLLNYSSVRDEDAGERSNRIEKSLVPGYEGRDRTYARRMISLKLSAIGVTEYDSSIRSLHRLLFETDQPAVVVHNYGTNPERAWLYQYDGPNWSSPMTRVLRDVALPMAEVGPMVR